MKHGEEIKHSFPFGTSAGTIFKSPVSPGNAPLVWPEEPCSKYFRTGIFGNLLNTNTIQYFIQEIKKTKVTKYLSKGNVHPSLPPLSPPGSPRMGKEGLGAKEAKATCTAFWNNMSEVIDLSKSIVKLLKPKTTLWLVIKTTGKHSLVFNLT